MPSENQRRSWNRAGTLYQERHAIATDTVYYGPLAPREDELNLLGDVAGLRIVEIGCGGGQNSVVLARRGATVVGIDVSDDQIAFARDLAAAESVPVDFVRSDAADLSFLASAAWDQVLAVYSFPYIEAIDLALAECARVLRTGGRLILSQDHPIRACYWDETNQEETILPARSYFDRRPLRWPFAGTDVAMTSHHRTLAQWIDHLHGAGFAVGRLMEFPLPADLADEPWSDEYTAEIAAHLPQTLIIVAQKI